MNKVRIYENENGEYAIKYSLGKEKGDMTVKDGLAESIRAVLDRREMHRVVLLQSFSTHGKKMVSREILEDLKQRIESDGIEVEVL